MQSKTPLALLHDDIDTRVRIIREGHPDWLCGKGCGGCCRRLADVPQLTAVEWDLLRQGLAALAPERLADLRRDLAALADQQSRPVTCPLLDQTTNACLVYAQRPVACRTYGFYVQRDQGLYCHDIEGLVTSGTLADVVWGNHDAIERRLAGLGEARPLTEWFAHWVSNPQ
ncbi:MAG TPA: YkgJ family cysteine cluster protein [Lamprocystis sp. (in: g-proteobacteria)]|nr:YkgJ family cysteine cluster protein [Lamprocystis sp. (in: g-proteobacteria)]